MRYEYVLSEKKTFFYEKMKILNKRSLTKALLWQHPRLLSTDNYFKCPILIILKFRKLHQPTATGFGTARQKLVGGGGGGGGGVNRVG